MAALKITSSTYLQVQIAEWIPLGGDFPASWARPSLITSKLATRTLCQPRRFSQSIIGTLELNGFSFRGEFTDFATGLLVGMDGGAALPSTPALASA